MPTKERKLINKVRTLVGLESQLKLEDAETEDGAMLYTESFAPGEAIFTVSEDGTQIPLAPGQYTLTDGRVITVKDEGIIADVTSAEVEETLAKAIAKTITDVRSQLTNLKKENTKLKLTASKSGGIKRNPEGNSRIVQPVKNPLFMTQQERVHDAMAKTPFYNNIKLATDVTNTSTYAGEFAGQYIAAATLPGVTLGANAITIKPNVKYKEVVKRISQTDILADATCDFTDTGTVVLDEKVLEPKELQVNLTLCKLDFQSDWEAIAMGYSAFDVLPPNFQAYFAENMANEINAAVETGIWEGVESNAGEFGGFAPAFKVDTDVIDVDNTGITIDETTIIAELGRVADAIPNTLYNSPDLTIYMAQNCAKAYTRALGGFGTAGLGGSGYQSRCPVDWFK